MENSQRTTWLRPHSASTTYRSCCTCWVPLPTSSRSWWNWSIFLSRLQCWSPIRYTSWLWCYPNGECPSGAAILLPQRTKPRGLGGFCKSSQRFLGLLGLIRAQSAPAAKRSLWATCLSDSPAPRCSSRSSQTAFSYWEKTWSSSIT